MNKKKICLIALALSLISLSGCGSMKETGENDTRNTDPENQQDETGMEEEITIQKLLEANQTASLLERYDSILAEFLYEPGVDLSEALAARYMDSEIAYSDFSFVQELHMGGNVYFSQEELYFAGLQTTADDLSDYTYPSLDGAATGAEVITDVLHEDDRITVTTQLPPEEMQRIYEEYGVEYTEGDYTVEEYILNATDYALISDTSTLCHADGTSEPAGGVSLIYNAERPVDAERLYTHVKMYETMDAEDSRTVTLILNPNTDQEQISSVSVLKGDVVSVVFPDGYSTLYLDAECTQPYLDSETEDLNADLTVYSVPDSE